MHQSVLLHEVIHGLDPKPGETVIDGTVNGGGHSETLADRIGSSGTLIGFDMDAGALEKASTRLSAKEARVILRNQNFREMDAALRELGIHGADKILLDLGWSSNQLDAGRGFSFQKDEPLLMTYKADPNPEDLTAADIVNSWEEENIATILFHLGEERYSRRIAKAITEARQIKPIATTRELVSIIEKAVPAAYRRGRIHAATRTFQALRIATNDELRALEEALRKGLELLRPRGRMAVISFHSLEDRIVKTLFRAFSIDGKGSLLTKKPIVASEEEILNNPRSRSAKLRIIEKK